MDKVKKFYDKLSKKRACNKEGDIIIDAKLHEELVDYFNKQILLSTPLTPKEKNAPYPPVGTDAYFERLLREGRFTYREEI
jgi:hypothetical protein